MVLMAQIPVECGGHLEKGKAELEVSLINLSFPLAADGHLKFDSPTPLPSFLSPAS